MKLTQEQLQVVHHPLGQHARVLAVAGSGKSTTMAHRIKYLVLEHHVRPNAIQVLMFNALARKQFTKHLNLPETRQPIVHTFHSFSFRLINEMVKESVLPLNTKFWLADKTELIWLTVKRAITNLEKAKRIPPEAVDPEDALNTIGLWKGSLIPPERAGSFISAYLPLVYKEFERLRLEKAALTFSDFIPLAIDILENNPLVYERWCRELRHLIIDEYQDINFGQQRLIELLAGDRADLMVVGDDDQTIYEWRGARPSYIIRDFAMVFNNKPVKDYHLSRSFRFGPIIAQCAANVIALNANRVDKPLIAFQSHKESFIHVIDGGYSSNKELTDQVLALTKVDGVLPNEIIVLARLFAQLDNLEAEFLNKEIPYRVEGQEPFYKRREIMALLDYIHLAKDYQKPMTDKIGKRLLGISNKPSRMLSRKLLNKLVSIAKHRKMSTKQLLEEAAFDHAFGVSHWQANQITDLWHFMEALQERTRDPTLQAGDLLAWMVEKLDYLEYFQDYYGKGEHSDEKRSAVTNFIRYLSNIHISHCLLFDHIEQLDTTQGKPEDEQIVFTSIFRTKGLEYDFIVIPECDENALPYLRGERTDIYDTEGIVRENLMSESIEAERRLFYVAITRARKGVLIGTSTKPSRFIAEINLRETEPIMGAIQWLANGDQRARDDLIDAMQNGGVPPNLLHNLISGYLPDMGENEMISQIQNGWMSSSPSQETGNVVKEVIKG